MENDKERDRDLPEDLLVEILVKLPIYYVFRCKCISKRWNSIISESSFPRIYISHTTNDPKFSPRFLFFHDVIIPHVPREIRDAFPPPVDSELHKLLRAARDDPLQPPRTLIYLPPTSLTQHLNLKVIAASSGLFLLCTYDRYYVYNFVTKEHVAIAPDPDDVVTSHFVGFITQMEGPFVKCFRIVQVRDQGNDIVFRVYSSEDATWDERRFMADPDDHWDARLHFTFKESFHWVDCYAGIIAYNPFHDEYRLLQFPDSRPVRSYRVCFSVSKEHIRLVETPEVVSELHWAWICAVWRLEDYDKEEWCLERRITYDWSCINITTPSDLVPLVCHPEDPKVVYLWYFMHGLLISFNLETKKILFIDHSWKHLNFGFMSKAVLSVEIPIWPSLIPGPRPRPSR